MTTSNLQPRFMGYLPVETVPQDRLQIFHADPKNTAELRPSSRKRRRPESPKCNGPDEIRSLWKFFNALHIRLSLLEEEERPALYRYGSFSSLLSAVEGFVRRISLLEGEEYIKQHFHNTPPRYLCPATRCSKDFKKQDVFHRHIRESKDRGHKALGLILDQKECFQCDLQFSRGQGFYEHERRIHGDSYDSRVYSFTQYFKPSKTSRSTTSTLASPSFQVAPPQTYYVAKAKDSAKRGAKGTLISLQPEQTLPDSDVRSEVLHESENGDWNHRQIAKFKDVQSLSSDDHCPSGMISNQDYNPLGIFPMVPDQHYDPSGSSLVPDEHYDPSGELSMSAISNQSSDPSGSSLVLDEHHDPSKDLSMAAILNGYSNPPGIFSTVPDQHYDPSGNSLVLDEHYDPSGNLSISAISNQYSNPPGMLSMVPDHLSLKPAPATIANDLI